MIDNHIHIGQFDDIYYDPLEITDIVLSSGMEGMSFSSSTSCKNGVTYQEIEREIECVLARYDSETARPFLWYIPDYIKWNISAETAFDSIPYKGIKLHSYMQHWDFDNTKHIEALHGLFNYAAQNCLPVLIHTGHNGIDSADRFEYFFAEYQKVRCILAHCRPLDITIAMLAKYVNVYCDTAFVPEADLHAIVRAGFQAKIIFGTDFPITHFFNMKFPKKPEKPANTLREQYAQDIASLSLDLWSNAREHYPAENPTVN